MAKLKILKSGETDINSTDIWRFAMHSDYKNQKVTEIYETTFTLPVGSSWLNGDYVSGVVNHNLGRYLAYYAEVFFDGKSYPVVGDASPQIPLEPVDPDPLYGTVGAGFRITTDENNAYIECWATGFGETATNNTFTIRFRFIIDDLV